VRLLVVHNLTYLERLVAEARDAIRAGRFAAYRKAILGGAPPWQAAGPP
jgi:queuine/archaeosine tRNA-ribosyltransferase